MNHLRPLARSKYCERAVVVCVLPIPETDKVRWIAPPRWLCAVFGETPARLLTFVVTVIKCKPAWVGGFHLVPNGLTAALVAPLVGARSLHFCGGGAREVLDGGSLGNRVLEEVKLPDPQAERLLLHAMNGMDRVICMGARSVEFYRSREVRTEFEVIPGGIDGDRFRVGNCEKRFDVVFVGRLEEVKRVDLLLEAVALLSESIPEITAAIVGSGQLQDHLRELANRLQISGRVVFAGAQTNVVPWLQQSRVFVLPSDSEGVSLSMMEALSCGLPCVVADVGDLGEVVQNGINGFLVRGRTGAAFAEVLQGIIRNSVALERLSAGAATSAISFELNKIVSRWDRIFATL
jgi:glycosyltransferase involved in cell wall biosynthesis